MLYENNLSADSIIDNWEKDRFSIFNILLSENDCKNIWSPISSTINCSCNSSCINAYNISGSCKGCIIISRLFVGEKIIPNKEFKIDYGKYSNYKYILNQYSFTNSDSYLLKQYKLTTSPKNIGQLIISNFQMMQSCESLFTTLIDSSNFYLNKGIILENYFIISCILEGYLKKSNFPTFPLQKWLYSCNGTVNIISELPFLKKEGEEEEKEENYVINILLQLVSTLHLLSNYGFIHSKPSNEFLILNNKECEYDYDGIKIKSPITLHLNPSCYSSINISNKRLYFNSDIRETTFNLLEMPTIEVLPFLDFNNVSSSFCKASTNTKEKIGIPMCNKYSSVYRSCYLIGENNIGTFKKCIIEYGLPIFYSSYELYSFLIAFLKSNENNLKYLLSNFKLFDIWKKLWYDKEYDKVINELLNLNSELSSDDILIFLSKYHLRCDALHFFWNSLKNLIIIKS